MAQISNGSVLSRWLGFRRAPSLATRWGAGAICIACVLALWVFVTAGEDPIVRPTTIGAPGHVFGMFPELWFQRELSRNIMASLWRLAQGFGLAALIGVPLGILCGTWPLFNAFLAPVSIFGRNVPVTALLPLTILWFGIDEAQKIGFIFVACIMFVLFDSAHAIASVREHYVQTALTLGASKLQVMWKVLVPLALPNIVSSLRMLFGLAFGYIVCAELINTEYGIGALILVSQRLGKSEHVYLALLAITLVAYGIDRLLYACECWLFPYREAN